METSEKSVNESFVTALCKIPELQRSFVWMKENPAEVNKIINIYLSLLNGLTSLDDKKIKQIKTARELMDERDIKLKSASQMMTDEFILDTRRSDLFSGAVSKLFDGNSNVHVNGLNNLSTMMLNGSNVVAETNEPPGDSDPTWDEVIWGHTQARVDVDPPVMMHFVFSHYLCQCMNYSYGKDSLLSEKDDFINVLADLILLENALSDEETDLYKVWSTSKQDGGLGWITPEQLDVYQEVVNS